MELTIEEENDFHQGHENSKLLPILQKQVKRATKTRRMIDTYVRMATITSARQRPALLSLKVCSPMDDIFGHSHAVLLTHRVLE